MLLVGAFNQEKALVEAFSVIVNLRMDLFEALTPTPHTTPHHSYYAQTSGGFQRRPSYMRNSVKHKVFFASNTLSQKFT